MKPEDVKPRAANLFTDSGQMMPLPTLVFTASDTAQIAKAYAHARHVFREALRKYKRLREDYRNADHYYYLSDKAYQQIQAFEKLFAEWLAKADELEKMK